MTISWMLGVQFLVAAQMAADKPQLIGRAELPADMADKSGLTGDAAPGVPNDRLGSCGSSIAWTGEGDDYVMVDDRGPGDGAYAFACRFQRVRISIDTKSAEPVRMQLISTTLLQTED
ncbi:MAG TPA: hypothetical protein VG711_03535, partial [Phycisphaerales bacterium]|nr:hypothetical protein [Phycisphaerales bacterium]